MSQKATCSIRKLTATFLSRFTSLPQSSVVRHRGEIKIHGIGNDSVSAETSLLATGERLFPLTRKCASARDDRICNENQSVERRPLSANAFRRCRLKPSDEWRKKKESTCVRARYWSHATRYTAPAPLRAQRRADYVHAPFSHDVSRDTCFSWFAFGLSVESSRWRVESEFN